MKKNQTALFISALLLMTLVLSCGWNRSASTSAPLGNSNLNANDDGNSTTAKAPAADCPKAALSVNQTKNKGLEKYEGCLLSVEGKIWEVSQYSITLIDTAERTDYNHALYIGGDYSSGTYSDIGMKISRLKINGEYEKLPVATFSGLVITSGGYTSLKNAVLTDVKKQSGY